MAEAPPGDLHSDGGIAVTLFLGIDLNGFKCMADTYRERHPDTPLPKIRLWAIVNQKLVELGRRLGADPSSWETGPPDPYTLPAARTPADPMW